MEIEFAIQKYKSQYLEDCGLAEELYKWKLITEQYQRPNPNADNLAEEIHAINYYNLVYGPQYYDVITYAEEAREIVSNALNLLFDEGKTLQDRISGFKTAIDSCWDIIKDKYPERKKKACDERLTSFFLTLHDPETYTFYKNDLYLYLCKLTGEQKKNTGKKLVHYYDMLNKYIIPRIKEDKEFMEAIDSELDKFGYRKSDLLVAQTVLWMTMPRPESVVPKTEPRYWIYAPGENADYWQTCQDKGIMAIGWHEIGDLRQFSTIDELKESARDVFENDNNWSQSGLALWQFVHDMKAGDIVIAKKGRSKIIGSGIVMGEYQYVSTDGEYPNIRAVEWTKIGNWPWENERLLPMKTLTRISDDGSEDEYIKQLLRVFDKNTEPVGTEPLINASDEPKYWWLIAVPKFFSFADKPIGTKEKWTLKNENGHKRKVYKDLESARVGDIVICYDANPTKQIVALAVVSRASDGETIEFQKTETLLYPLDWADIKTNPDLSEMKFVKNHMAMTFCSLTDDEADTIMGMIRERNVKETPKAPTYTMEDFLNEVFMTEPEYERLLSLLEKKKNIILQGAPGVGKTFTAKRLAYSIIGRKDKAKVEVIQFHQNYSYEDFIMGYKPTDDGGFTLRNGIFYSFCKRAAVDKGNKYFFVIDEINRGNLSKISGELLMLIENGYRGKDIRLAYNGEEFSVPENVYLIGMMNTADRSLAMIDYALRRRFSFFDIKPGFDSDGFKKMQAEIGNEKFDKVVDAIRSLNKSIEDDASLGAGFCIGHSYFCLPEDEEYSDVWLQNIIDYDIEPMLREYWFDNQERSIAEISKIKSLLK